MKTKLEPLLTEREVAKVLNVSIATIRRRRLFRQPPEWLKLGSTVRYKPDTIRRLIDQGNMPMSTREAARER